MHFLLFLWSFFCLLSLLYGLIPLLCSILRFILLFGVFSIFIYVFFFIVFISCSCPFSSISVSFCLLDWVLLLFFRSFFLWFSISWFFSSFLASYCSEERVVVWKSWCHLQWYLYSLFLFVGFFLLCNLLFSVLLIYSNLLIFASSSVYLCCPSLINIYIC